MRGDGNADGLVDISDAVTVLAYLFDVRAAPSCLQSVDANDDGQLDIADTIRLLTYLFADGPPLPEPFGACGSDMTPDALTCVSYAPCSEAGVPRVRLERLTNGINVTRPFWGYQWSYGTFDASYARRTFGLEEIETIRALGFRHVRLPIAERDLVTPGEPAQLNATMLSALTIAVRDALAGGLAVIMDLHASDEYKEALQFDGAAVENMAKTWGALAGVFSAMDPDLVYFEVLNEPVFDDGSGGYAFARWAAVLAELHAAIRAAAPDHTIIAGGADWNGIDGLEALEPLADPNVVYNFHFYEPFIFTHQGASWGGEPWVSFHDVPYPSSPASVAPLLDEFVPGSQAYDFLEWYGDIRADRAWVAACLKPAVDWAARHGVPLTCNEFGVYKPYSPRPDLLAWHRDVCELFDAHGIGWCKWEYDEGFGIVTYLSEEFTDPTPDGELIAAMGLAP